MVPTTQLWTIFLFSGKIIDLAAVRPGRLLHASEGIFLMSSFSLSSARAEASRRNGAKSRGPGTPEGKARSARNALKHGFRAQTRVVLAAEDGAAFEAHETALMEELAPEGALQTVLARRIVAATWRLERAEKSRASCSPRTTTRAAGSASR
jgi:hypothetical protein